MLSKTYTLSQIEEIAEDIIAYCEEKIILFYGEMGAGKTTLIKNIIKKLGSADEITSPTFSIVNEYQTLDGKPIFHFDFYRIQNDEEVAQLGLEEYFSSDGWIFIEWPENINTFSLKKAHTARIKSTNYETRTLVVS